MSASQSGTKAICPASKFCVPRERLGVAPGRHLFTETVRPLAQPTTPGAFYGGYRLMAIDIPTPIAWRAMRDQLTVAESGWPMRLLEW
jgi:hypothetical protein